MALSDIDRKLLVACLRRKPGAWEAFVDRFLGVVFHVIHQTADARNIHLEPDEQEDLCAAVFSVLLRDNFAVLNKYRGNSSLASYLAVTARRVVVRALLAKSPAHRHNTVEAGAVAGEP
jgi:RNA polymerase sigma-70 factor (ECF subfamily)